jgi:hypothetical protein
LGANSLRVSGDPWQSALVSIWHDNIVTLLAAMARQTQFSARATRFHDADENRAM